MATIGETDAVVKAADAWASSMEAMASAAQNDRELKNETDTFDVAEGAL